MGKRSNKGLWTPEEDILLIKYIQSHGEGHWRTLPERAGLQRRCGKGCRMRWMNYLRPNVKRGNISSDEEDLIIKLHKLLGNRWSLIAGRLPNRTDTEIKNYWNTHLRKKLKSNTHHYTTASNSHVEPPKMKPILQHTNAQLECSKPVDNSNYKNLCIPTRDPSNGNFSKGNAGQYNYEVDNIVPQQGPQEVYYLLNNTHFNTHHHYQADTRNNITYAYETRPINAMDTSCMGSFSNYSVGEYSEINHGNQLGDLSLMSRGQDGFLSTENGFIFHEKPVQQYSSGEYVDGYNYLQQLRKLNVYEDQLSTFLDESISEVGNCIQVGWSDNFCSN